MSPPLPPAEKDDKAPPQVQTLSTTHDAVLKSPALNAEPKRVVVDSNGFLTAPGAGLLRPLSPDTLSNFSFEEVEQLRPELLTLPPPHHVDDEHTPRKTTGWRARLRAFRARNLGLFYMLLSQFFGTCMNVTTRLLEVEGNGGKGLHPVQILFARMSITFVLASAYMWWTRTPHFPLGAPEIRWLLVLRGCAGFFGVFGMYYSLLYLPLADATVITFLAPSLACWACSILIKEPFTRAEKIGGLVSLVGVVLIARPATLFEVFSSSSDGSSSTDAAASQPSTAAADYDGVTPLQRLSAVGVALLGVLGAATAYTTLRWIGKRAHPLISVNYFSGWSTLVSITAQLALPSIGFFMPTAAKDWGYLIFLGSCGFVTQYFLVCGLTYEKSSRATNLAYTQMLFALAFDKIFFGHTPGGLSIVGSSLILGSAIVVAMQKSAAVPAQGAEAGQTVADEESQVGLLSEDAEAQSREEDAVAAQSVEMRSLR